MLHVRSMSAVPLAVVIPQFAEAMEQATAQFTEERSKAKKTKKRLAAERDQLAEALEKERVRTARTRPRRCTRRRRPRPHKGGLVLWGVTGAWLRAGVCGAVGLTPDLAFAAGSRARALAAVPQARADQSSSAADTVALLQAEFATTREAFEAQQAASREARARAPTGRALGGCTPFPPPARWGCWVFHKRPARCAHPVDSASAFSSTPRPAPRAAAGAAAAPGGGERSGGARRRRARGEARTPGGARAGGGFCREQRLRVAAAGVFVAPGFAFGLGCLALRGVFF